MTITFEELRALMKSNRTVRRFDGKRTVHKNDLERLVELVRYCPSGRNAQPLRYLIVTDEEMKDIIYPCLQWAGYFADWDGPEIEERPGAYLIQCLDTNLGANSLCDDGLQLEAITLGMHTLGMGGCIIKAFNAVELKKALGLENRYEPRYVLAVGYPAEKVVLEDMDGSDNADFKYYRSHDGVHHVPKRPLEELIL